MSDRTESEPAQQGVAVVWARPSATAEEEGGPASPRTARHRTSRPGGTRPIHLVTAVAGLFRRRGRSAQTVGGRSQNPRWLVPVMMVVTTLALFIALLFGLAWGNLNSQQSAQSDVKNVSRQFLVAYTNFTPTNLDAKFQTLQGLATGNFVTQADQIFGSNIRQALKQAQVSSEGEIRYLFVQSLQGTQASVYAWVDQTAVNNKVPKPFTDTLQMQLTLIDTNQGWKVTGARVLNSPTLSFPTGGSGSGGSSGGSSSAGH